MTETMKKLTKIKLVNWHYFSNETIHVNGSFLVSGENASGKSTILDAIQLVLTTNTRRFNPAANEKSKRDLKGYVRCKTGEEGNVYHRAGSVISYIALEFYEESKDKYFVIGVKLDSPDLDSDIKRKWFCEEGVLDAFTFIVDNKPALDDQFKNNGKKVGFIHSQSEAKSRFKRRMGNLDDTFFDMIPKSLAFKPMDDVKSFINKFILSEKQIEVDVLRENIRNLREMQNVIDEVKAQIKSLEAILAKYDEIQATDKDILVIDILIKIAELEAKKDELSRIKFNIKEIYQNLAIQNETRKAEKALLESEEIKLKEIEYASRQNEYTQLLEKLKNDLALLENNEKHAEEKLAILKKQIALSIQAVDTFAKQSMDFSAKDIYDLANISLAMESRNKTIIMLEKAVSSERERAYAESASNNQKVVNNKETLLRLNLEIENLKKNRITYPENTERLKAAIEEEFTARAIDSEVRIFADLLEITDSKWQDAVEGYLNTQRFNIIVEPRYYDIAAEVYNRVKRDIHSVALVNTASLKLDEPMPENSLASVIKSDNRFAKAYAIYLMGRVIRCNSVEDLKAYPIAITSACMLYQSKALRKIDTAVYRTPYIGKFALKRQLELKQAEYNALNAEQEKLNVRQKELEQIISKLSQCNFELLKDSVSAPDVYAKINAQIKQIKAEIKEVENEPSIIELTIKADELSRKIAVMKDKCGQFDKLCNNLERDIEDHKKRQSDAIHSISVIEKEIERIGNGNQIAIQAANQKFSDHLRQKDAGTIFTNYQPRKATLQNQRTSRYGELTSLQTKFKDSELGVGEDVITSYTEEYDHLSKHDLIMYEEKLVKAKSDCELEFRENFLAKMRENIEQAEEVFKNLNKALKSIYYGNDSYKFHLTHNKMKEGLYKMITSDVNIGGMTLFSNIFEDQYRSEMDDLFSKLTESDIHGDIVLKEYIDYRSYLDYDIEIISKDGKSQFFSKIYGEKSGGETQTPYYVAIAASFSQIYSYGESIRIIMLDEAFDKMDDDRIASMMGFFKSQKFQVILATPPAKMEIVGEYVDTILMTYRQGYASTVEEYTYEEI